MASSDEGTEQMNEFNGVRAVTVFAGSDSPDLVPGTFESRAKRRGNESWAAHDRDMFVRDVSLDLTGTDLT